MTKSEAEKELLDRLMWGEKYLNVDITYVMDGEPVDELLLLLTNIHDMYERDLAASKWLEANVKRFIESETGQKLVYSLIADHRESEQLSVLEARAELLYQEA